MMYLDTAWGEQPTKNQGKTTWIKSVWSLIYGVDKEVNVTFVKETINKILSVSSEEVSEEQRSGMTSEQQEELTFLNKRESMLDPDGVSQEANDIMEDLVEDCMVQSMKINKENNNYLLAKIYQLKSMLDRALLANAVLKVDPTVEDLKIKNIFSIRKGGVITEVVDDSILENLRRVKVIQELGIRLEAPRKRVPKQPCIPILDEAKGMRELFTLCRNVHQRSGNTSLNMEISISGMTVAEIRTFASLAGSSRAKNTATSLNISQQHLCAPVVANRAIVMKAKQFPMKERKENKCANCKAEGKEHGHTVDWRECPAFQKAFEMEFARTNYGLQGNKMRIAYPAKVCSIAAELVKMAEELRLDIILFQQLHVVRDSLQGFGGNVQVKRESPMAGVWVRNSSEIVMTIEN
ncbi:hypothetical protein PR048_023362 [Dryococelus australis]|uniref:Uncharacterized protein n=1 Tax=Dryococelus australis TaxID=614101 RepID=A0ABQ9GTW1_9NEOP|nr:hypothetical protein PR048_023362 [Dryococelus australis]